MMQRINYSDSDFDSKLTAKLQVDETDQSALQDTVKHIIGQIRTHGDTVLLELTRKFDTHPARHVAELQLSLAACQQAFAALDNPVRDALVLAAERIRDFHQRQVQQGWTYVDNLGNTLGQKITPLDRVGVYVPGGKASYPSSVLMNVIPAIVAGVPEVIMVVPAPNGELNPLVLAAAHVAGVHKIFTIGGAQAIAALAYGTATIPRVDKITGPGNQYVAAAKREVFGQVGIDMIAGPSEVLVVADGNSNPDWVAMDLLSQAEHDELAQAICISDSATFLDALTQSIARLLPTLPRAATASKSLRNRGLLIQVGTAAQTIALINRIAPEHLQLFVEQPEALLGHIRHAGAIFMGRYTPEALGDYCAGPNHVLPTSGTARFSSPLGVYDFVKRSSIIYASASGAVPLATAADTLAMQEGLQAHALSARYRTGGNNAE